MTAAILASSPQHGTPFHQRLASPIPSSASSRSTAQTPDPTPDSSSKTFQRFRSSLEQSIRTATRSKRAPPPADEFATLTATAKNKGKEKERPELPPKEEKMGMLRRVAFGKRESSPPPKEKAMRRVAGFTSFITPSMRQATVSSPALHISSPSQKSRPAIPSTADPTASPSRTRSRKTSSQPSPTPPTGGPSRHRSTKSHPPGIPPSPSTPTVNQLTPTRSTRTSRDRDRDLPSPPDTPTLRGGAFITRTPSKKTSPLPRTPSPVNTRSSSSRSIATRGLTSASTSHLPSSSPSPPPTPTVRRPSVDYNHPPSTPRRPSQSRRPSIDQPPPSPGLKGTRRGSVDSQSRPLTSRPGSESPSPSPSGGIRPRAITPVQRSYAQNRHFNISSGSLVLGSTSPTSSPTLPVHVPSAKIKDDGNDGGTRDLIRTATSMICREVSSSKPPLHMSRTEQGIKDWEEVELRMRALVRLERVWGRSAHNSPGTSSSGEERERKIFVDALRDGYVLCQYVLFRFFFFDYLC